jgi:hypothetical protein
MMQDKTLLSKEELPGMKLGCCSRIPSFHSVCQVPEMILRQYFAAIMNNSANKRVDLDGISITTFCMTWKGRI